MDIHLSFSQLSGDGKVMSGNDDGSITTSSSPSTAADFYIIRECFTIWFCIDHLNLKPMWLISPVYTIQSDVALFTMTFGNYNCKTFGVHQTAPHSSYSRAIFWLSRFGKKSAITRGYCTIKMPNNWKVSMKSTLPSLMLLEDVFRAVMTTTGTAKYHKIGIHMTMITLVFSVIAWQYLTIHYSDVIMSAMASQITNISTVCSAVCLGVHHRKHQSSALLAFVREIHRQLVDSPHKGAITRIFSIWCRHRGFLFSRGSML